MNDELLSRITNYYLESRDFNGISSRQLADEFKISFSDLSEYIKQLVIDDLVELRFGDGHPNPYIKAWDEYNKEKLLSLLNAKKLKSGCIYPNKKHLENIIDKNKYSGEPFRLRLVLGENQLAFQAFDLSVLEFYRNDPRYYYHNHDIGGSIYFNGNDSTENEDSNPDDVYLQDFGFCYNEKKERAIAVFLRRLYRLSPEHQQIWNAKKLEGNYKLHPDFYRSAILGDWYEGLTIIDALLLEQENINKLCKIIGIQPLFKTTYSYENKPKEFTFLIRPTLREFNNFILLLDKMISENLNPDFFSDMNLEKEELRKDGKIMVRRKGTIELFEEWFRKHFSPRDKESFKSIIKKLRNIRRMRQEPAHALREDEFDQKYVFEQREVLINAYDAIHLIRTAFEQHPKVSSEEREKLKDDRPIWIE